MYIFNAHKFDTAVTNFKYLVLISLVKQTSVAALFQEGVYDCIAEVAWEHKLSIK